MSTQLHDIDILNYYMHKYVEAVKLLVEFEILYDIKVFKKMQQIYFLLLNYFQSSRLILELGMNKIQLQYHTNRYIVFLGY